VNGFDGQIANTVRALEIQSATTYAWFGRPFAELERALLPALTPAATTLLLRSLIAQRLYVDVFQRGHASPARPARRAVPQTASAAFEQELARANSGQGMVQDGWIVESVGTDPTVIQANGLSIHAGPTEFVRTGRRPLGIGDVVGLRLPNGLPHLNPGYYTALGDEPFDTFSLNGTTVVRLYWHVTASGAPTLLQLVTGNLNRVRLPFQMKVANHPSAYGRCDAAVLYLRSDDLVTAVPALETVHASIANRLMPAIPVLTKQIALGVGLAEDPGNGESFGMQRCRLLAEGIVRGWETGARSLERRLEVVAETFAEAGISFEQPYLNPGSTDVYDFAWSPPPVRQVSGPAALRHELLDCANSIGQRLAADAIWHAERCTWLGATGEPDGPRLASLAPALYDGTAGVALFLAELHAAAPDAAVRAAALGAARQALATTDRIIPPLRLGLYTGVPGVAWAVTRIGDLLDEPTLLTAARQLLARLPELASQPHQRARSALRIGWSARRAGAAGRALPGCGLARGGAAAGR
jgi:hypothetical protein